MNALWSCCLRGPGFFLRAGPHLCAADRRRSVGSLDGGLTGHRGGPTVGVSLLRDGGGVPSDWRSGTYDARSGDVGGVSVRLADIRWRTCNRGRRGRRAIRVAGRGLRAANGFTNANAVRRRPAAGSGAGARRSSSRRQLLRASLRRGGSRRPADFRKAVSLHDRRFQAHANVPDRRRRRRPRTRAPVSQSAARPRRLNLRRPQRRAFSFHTARWLDVARRLRRRGADPRRNPRASRRGGKRLFHDAHRLRALASPPPSARPSPAPALTPRRRGRNPFAGTMATTASRGPTPPA